MTQNNLDNTIISTSSTHSFNFEWQSGEKHIQITWNTDVNLFFFIHNAHINLIIDVIDEKCSVFCSAIVVSAWNIPSSIDFAVTLKASYTKADVYALCLLWNNAKASVNGGVVIDPDIIQAEGYLAEENLLLGEKIQIKTLPMLDVRSNDVKASHGATISRLDEQKLFYLTAKWLPKATAEQLMIQSYIQKALDHAKIEDDGILIDRIFSLLQTQK
jgi:SUF system FeS cluster assembly, SufBD